MGVVSGCDDGVSCLVLVTSEEEGVGAVSGVKVSCVVTSEEEGVGAVSGVKVSCVVTSEEEGVGAVSGVKVSCVVTSEEEGVGAVSGVKVSCVVTSEEEGVGAVSDVKVSCVVTSEEEDCTLSQDILVIVHSSILLWCRWSRDLVTKASKTQYVDLPSIHLGCLRERGVVLRCADFLVDTLRNDKSKRSREHRETSLPVVTSDKKTFNIPDDVHNPAFQVGLSIYFYSNKYGNKFLGKLSMRSCRPDHVSVCSCVGVASLWSSGCGFSVERWV